MKLLFAFLIASLILIPQIAVSTSTDFGGCVHNCYESAVSCYDDCLDLPAEEQGACNSICVASYESCLYTCEYTYGFCEDLGYIPEGDCENRCEDLGYILPDDYPSTSGGGTSCTPSECEDMGYMLVGGGTVIESTYGTVGVQDACCMILPFSPCILIVILGVAIAYLVAANLMMMRKKKRRKNDMTIWIALTVALIIIMLIIIIFVLPMLGECCMNLPIDPCILLIIFIITTAIIAAITAMRMQVRKRKPKRRR